MLCGSQRFPQGKLHLSITGVHVNKTWLYFPTRNFPTPPTPDHAPLLSLLNSVARCTDFLDVKAYPEFFWQILLEPGMVTNASNGDAVGWIANEDFADEVHTFSR